MTQQILVEASEEDVRTTLAAALSPDELASLGFEEKEKATDMFDPGKRGEAVTFMTIVIWTGGAVASGVVYDLIKKATLVLVDKFGTARVKTEEQP